MARAKQTSKRKGSRTALPALGAAGVSFAIAGGTSAALASTVNDQAQRNAPPPVFLLGEEELSDVSLATFYVFDRENSQAAKLGEKVAARCGGCRGCGGAGRCG